MRERYIEVRNDLGKYSIKWEHVAGILECEEDIYLMLKDGTNLYIEDNPSAEYIKKCLGDHV